MSARWFRFYANAMRHPKVARLTDAQFRLWVELLSVAAENDGVIPCADDLKHMLKRRLDHLLRGLDDLIKASLIEPLSDGYTPHNWNKKQYKSDVSTDRVKKHRGKRNVSETPPEAETEAEAAKAASASPDDDEGIIHDVAHKAGHAAGLSNPEPGKIIEAQTIVRGWIKAGADPDLITSIIAARMAGGKISPRSLRYFDGAVREALEARPVAGSVIDAGMNSMVENILGRRVA